MQGRLKSITLQSSQEAWRVDLPEISTQAPTTLADGHPEARQHRVKISAARKRGGPSTLESVNEDDDDDFMPDRRRASSSRSRTNVRRTLGASTTIKLFYLDNLKSGISIHPFAIPRAKYFHKTVMEKLIQEDRRRDKLGNVTYGNLQLKNIVDTCYRVTEPDHSRETPPANSSSIPMFPRPEHFGVLLNEIGGSSSRNKATDCLQKFATKASQAIDLVESAFSMLVDAHKEFIRTMQSVLETDPVKNIGKDEYRSTQ